MISNKTQHDKRFWHRKLFCIHLVYQFVTRPLSTLPMELSGYLLSVHLSVFLTFCRRCMRSFVLDRHSSRVSFVTFDLLFAELVYRGYISRVVIFAIFLIQTKSFVL
jgi:hypothetical protein